MYANERIARNFILVLSGLATLGALAWLTLLDHGTRWPLVFGVVVIAALPGGIVMAYVGHDLTAERGRGLAEMRAAGYILAEQYAPIKLFWGLVTIPHTRRVWWIDYDGDGEVDEGEIVPEPEPDFPIRKWTDADLDPATAEARKQRIRSLLVWCYRRQAANESWDQKPGRKAFRGTYDDDMAELTRCGFVRARSTGHRGDLVLPQLDAALRRFDDGN